MKTSERYFPVGWVAVSAAWLCLLAATGCLHRSMSTPQTRRQSQTVSPDQLSKVSQSTVSIFVDIPPGVDIPPDLPPELKEKIHPGMSISLGSGFFVNTFGHVVTAAHVAREGSQILETLHQHGVTAFMSIGVSFPGKESQGSIGFGSRHLEGEVSDLYNAHDLALLKTKMNAFDFHPSPPTPGLNQVLGHSTPVAVKLSLTRPEDAEAIFTCGFPLGSMSLLTTQGIIASAWKVKVPANAAELGSTESLEMYQADLRIDHGNSGGPVFRSSDGAVIGMVVEVGTSSSAFAYILPAKYIKDFLEKSNVPWQEAK